MKKVGIISLLFCLLFQTIFAQKEKAYTTKEITSTIIIDGNLNEKSWNQVKWEGNFIQTEPENGEKPTFDTQFKILYDQNNLYVAIRAYDKHPDSIVISNKPRDFFDGDYVEINIDSDFDRKDAFSFTITAAGIRGDEHIKTSENWFNDWNPNWTAKTQIDNEGWIAEIKIPLSELEIHTKKKQWGIQVNRSLERLDEDSSWTSVPDEDKWVEYFGLLRGIENIPISKALSLTDKIKPELIKKDFSDLYNSLKSSYPSLYRYHSSDYIDENYNQTLEAIEKEMTLTDFYKTVSSFISKIGDGHMRVEFPDYYGNTYYEKLKKLPFKLKATGDEAFATENYSKNDLFNNAQIISINGKSVQEITNEMVELIPSDGYNLTGKYYRISNNFDFYHSLISDFDENAKIDFIPRGQEIVHSTEISLMTNTEIEKIKSGRKSEPNYKSFNYQTKNNVGILTIRTFNNAEGFQGFVDESFKKITESKIDKLILDLRGNGGGFDGNTSGIYDQVTLPYSRLKVKIPLVKYMSATGDAEYIIGRGVMPKYQMTEYQTGIGANENDRLINFGIEYLNSKK